MKGNEPDPRIKALEDTVNAMQRHINALENKLKYNEDMTHDIMRQLSIPGPGGMSQAPQHANDNRFLQRFEQHVQETFHQIDGRLDVLEDAVELLDA